MENEERERTCVWLEVRDVNKVVYPPLDVGDGGLVWGEPPVVVYDELERVFSSLQVVTVWSCVVAVRNTAVQGPNRVEKRVKGSAEQMRTKQSRREVKTSRTERREEKRCCSWELTRM